MTDPSVGERVMQDERGDDAVQSAVHHAADIRAEAGCIRFWAVEQAYCDRLVIPLAAARAVLVPGMPTFPAYLTAIVGPQYQCVNVRPGRQGTGTPPVRTRRLAHPC